MLIKIAKLLKIFSLILLSATVAACLVIFTRYPLPAAPEKEQKETTSDVVSPQEPCLEEVTVVGEINMIGNDPFGEYVIATPNGVSYGIGGAKRRELTRLEGGWVKVKGTIDPKTFMSRIGIQVCQYETILPHEAKNKALDLVETADLIAEAGDSKRIRANFRNNSMHQLKIINTTLLVTTERKGGGAVFRQDYRDKWFVEPSSTISPYGSFMIEWELGKSPQPFRFKKGEAFKLHGSTIYQIVDDPEQWAHDSQIQIEGVWR